MSKLLVNKEHNRLLKKANHTENENKISMTMENNATLSLVITSIVAVLIYY